MVAAAFVVSCTFDPRHLIKPLLRTFADFYSTLNVLETALETSSSAALSVDQNPFIILDAG